MQQNTEAIATNAGMLERDLNALSASHDALHEKVGSWEESLQSLSESITKVERDCEIKIKRHEQRMSTLESDFAERKEQWDHRSYPAAPSEGSGKRLLLCNLENG